MGAAPIISLWPAFLTPGTIRDMQPLLKKMTKKAIPLLSTESQLKRRVRAHLKRLGFVRNECGELTPLDGSKESIRALHLPQRSAILTKEKLFIKENWSKLKQYFANGSEVNPKFIFPRLELIDADTWQSRLFKLASLTWSVPVSQGYGRRLRFLVWDDQNDRLIGLIALGDPVFNLGVRDTYIGWNSNDRKKRLVNVLDAYVLGAVPPYNTLLGGKLVAALIKTKEVRDVFRKKYGDYCGVISGQKKSARLVLVTTTSALGRSSVYNRLRDNYSPILRSIGYTEGWGHFHVPNELFSQIRRYLTAQGHQYAKNYKFGDGPNWKLRALREAFTSIGLNPNLLKHGISREVFICEIASNAASVLRGSASTPRYNKLLTASEISEIIKDRWIVPRAMQRQEYLDWNRDTLTDSLDPRINRQRNASTKNLNPGGVDGARKL